MKKKNLHNFILIRTDRTGPDETVQGSIIQMKKKIYQEPCMSSICMVHLIEHLTEYMILLMISIIMQDIQQDNSGDIQFHHDGIPQNHTDPLHLDLTCVQQGPQEDSIRRCFCPMTRKASLPNTKNRIFMTSAPQKVTCQGKIASAVLDRIE
ncbi:uncharacterized protein B0P05DRAFT_541946 [Gilbertella persicaria]|uniref:uncharacterized protein n=1 Tax=Gilbertella persicaria TaxID=101096 RepID=UPI00221E8FAE|nr:uncharacterized protein B0P05DRAFT_541946 [Gilbertella persicaria]KAI8078986.1 hypothetical protein B0P05DRAFT_541946 [Gilbertella persicaria]